jgi:hypothetical protein
MTTDEARLTIHDNEYSKWILIDEYQRFFSSVVVSGRSSNRDRSAAAPGT